MGRIEQKYKWIGFAIAAFIGIGFFVVPAAAGSRATNDLSASLAFFNDINRERTRLGLNELKWDRNLASLATSWSGEMRSGKCNGPNLGKFDRICHVSDFRPMQSGVTTDWAKLGENVGVGPSVSSLTQGFFDSPGHYENVVKPEFTHIGIGSVWDSQRKTLYTTHRFMTVRSPKAETTTTNPPTTEPPVAETAGAGNFVLTEGSNAVAATVSFTCADQTRLTITISPNKATPYKVSYPCNTTETRQQLSIATSRLSASTMVELVFTTNAGNELARYEKELPDLKISEEVLDKSETTTTSAPTSTTWKSPQMTIPQATQRPTTTTARPAVTTTTRPTTTTTFRPTTTVRPTTTAGPIISAPAVKFVRTRLYNGTIYVQGTVSCSSSVETFARLESSTGGTSASQRSTSSCVNGVATISLSMSNIDMANEDTGGPHRYRVRTTFANSGKSSEARSHEFVRTNRIQAYPGVYPQADANGWVNIYHYLA